MSITSTVLTIRILEELGMIKDKSTVLILGISIVEDIIAITTLGIFLSVATNGDQISNLQVSISIGIVAAFIGSILLLGSKYVPKIIDKIAVLCNLLCSIHNTGYPCLFEHLSLHVVELIIYKFQQNHWVITR
jgi:Kef-type K+ transport system membrane component KefB